jgi:hypothetical protein
MRGLRRLPLVAAISAAALSAGATAALSLAQQDDSNAPVVIEASSGGDTDGFAALDRAQNADDRLPAGVLARFGPDNSTGPNVDQSTARKVASVEKTDIYIAEGTSSFCTINVRDDGGWSGGCTAKTRADSGQPQATFDLVDSADGNDYRVWGVAPSDVKSAALVLKNGTRVPGPIEDGAFSVTTDDAGTAFMWTDAQDIEHSQQVVLPPTQ